MTKADFRKYVKPGSRVKVLRTHSVLSSNWSQPTMDVVEGQEYKVLNVHAFQARINDKDHYLTPSVIEIVEDTSELFDKALEQRFSSLKKEIAAKQAELNVVETLMQLRTDFPKLDIRQHHVKIYNKLVKEFPNEEDEKLIKLAIKLK